MKFNCIAIDNDSVNIEVLSDYLSSLGNYRMVKSFTDPIKAMNHIIDGETMDVIFIEIEMPSMSGIELAKVIRSKTRNLIFTTAHPKYAIDAFEIGAEGYLLKPYSLSRFATVLHNLHSRKGSAQMDESNHLGDEYFFIKSKNDKSKLVKVRFDEIIAIESIQNYVSIYTVHKTVVAHITLTKIKEILGNKDYFIQIHRSFVISRNYLEEIENNLVRMKNDLLLTMGENYKNELIGFVKKRTIKTGRN